MTSLRAIPPALAFAALLLVPSHASAHRLDFDNVNSVVFNTLAQDWSCRPMGSHRVDCRRDFGDEEDYSECRDYVAFYLVGPRLHWRFYRDGCETGFRERPRWRGRLRPVPAALLRSQFTSGWTSQRRAIGMSTFRQYRDSGSFAFGSLRASSLTAEMRCPNGRRRVRFLDVFWEGADIRRRGGFSDTVTTDDGFRVSVRGRALGPARTRIAGTIRVRRAFRRNAGAAGRERCTSGRIRFWTSAAPLALF